MTTALERSVLNIYVMASGERGMSSDVRKLASPEDIKNR
jgi:hypothetical protein